MEKPKSFQQENTLLNFYTAYIRLTSAKQTLLLKFKYCCILSKSASTEKSELANEIVVTFHYECFFNTASQRKKSIMTTSKSVLSFPLVPAISMCVGSNALWGSIKIQKLLFHQNFVFMNVEYATNLQF